MMRRPHRFSRLDLVLTAVLAVGSASCAGSADVIAPSAARQMRTQMDDVRAAIDSGDAHAARLAIRALEREAVRLRATG